jgi:hypothetical protein
LLATWLKFIVKDEEVRTLIYKLAGGIFGLVLTFTFGIDLLSAVIGLVVTFEATSATMVVGRVCTGLMMGRGSNWLHDLGKKWFNLG